MRITPQVQQWIASALAEDTGSGDHTSLSCISAEAQGEMQLYVKQAGVLAGMNVAREVLRQVDDRIRMNDLMHDGDEIHPGDIAFTLHGPARKMLTAERTVLNFMQRMSGIATTTRQYVDLIKDTPAVIVDTRKTTPNMRVFEKYAVTVGGAQNHRFGLYDMILIKDNHVDFAGGIEKAIDAAVEYKKENHIDVPVEIEARNLDEVRRIVAHGGVQRIMFDNFTPDAIREAMPVVQHRFETEASGGITLETLHDYAVTGVDFISVGALTHHIASLDLSLKTFILTP